MATEFQGPQIPFLPRESWFLTQGVPWLGFGLDVSLRTGFFTVADSIDCGTNSLSVLDAVTDYFVPWKSNINRIAKLKWHDTKKHKLISYLRYLFWKMFCQVNPN